MLWRQEPNRGCQRQIRILADPFEFHETLRSGRVSDVDYDAEDRSTPYWTLWRQELNRCSERQIQIWADPFEFHQTQF